jgi:hypothetical protein
MNKERLLNIAKALREAPRPDKFTMSDVHACGTPACAFGHYAARRDLQQDFQLPTRCYENRDYPWIFCNTVLVGAWGATRPTAMWGREASNHFGIPHDQVNELFCSDGCGNAKTATQAAQYIKRFVSRAA